MTLKAKKAAEIERMAELLCRACERHKQRVSGLTPVRWELQYQCIQNSYRAMARAVLASLERRRKRS